MYVIDYQLYFFGEKFVRHYQGRALVLSLCSTLYNQQLLEKHLDQHLLNANALWQMFSYEAFIKAFVFIIYKIKENI